MSGDPRRAPQAYFAYGSNLLAVQMRQRCPDATHPRPAVLDDHRWLINERGVATVCGQHGSSVHGVLWDVSEGDLAVLDRIEGVPVNYRRTRCVVHAADGPVSAWVYIDHRTTPGSPRPGYLDRVVTGAEQQGLPSSWIALLRRG